MKLSIIKYNAGNIQSVLFALERLGIQAQVTDDVEEIRSADKVIFPGVGEASTAMQYLRERKLDNLIKDLEQPVLGVCLGMQLMCAHSTENDTTCLGIFEERVTRFYAGEPNEEATFALPVHTGTSSMAVSHAEAPAKGKLKVPQIGWNKIYNVKTDLFKGANNGYCYFVHSYYASLGEHTIATADYVKPYSAALHRDNFYGVQFHPEKSAEVGAVILENFINLL